MSTFPRSQEPDYIPTPQQIAEAAADIRRGWSMREHYVRAGALPPGWTEQRFGDVDPFQWTAPRVKAGCAQ